MAKRYDAAIKHLVEARPADWLAFAKLPPATALEVVDADVSSVTLAADKVIRVTAPVPYIAHLEFQSGADPDLDRRMLLYNVLLRWRHGLPVRSVAILLRPHAATAAVTGAVRDVVDRDVALEFRYRLIRVWEQPVETVLKSGLGTLPLAPVSAVTDAELPSVVDQMKRRLTNEASPSLAADEWAATFILMGLRYPRELILQLMKGVREMEESVTYQWIIAQGEARGRREGHVEGKVEGKVEEARALLLRLGSRRLGDPGAVTTSKIQSLNDLPSIESLLDRILDVQSWDELLDS